MWRDEHTGLYHTHYRLYDPQHVRWLTPDPSGYADGQNLYRFYAGPNGVDVLGLDILFAFDGTNNDEKTDTNIMKIFELYDGEKKVYLSGIGTKDDQSNKIKYANTAGLGAGSQKRINQAIKELEAYLSGNPNDKNVDIIGFSRGAATARSFVNQIQPILDKYGAKIRFIGVFDTVPSMGGAKENGGNLLFGEKVEHNLALPQKYFNQGVAYHAMAIHENREEFNMHRYKGAVEMWFDGVHADIGGGYIRGEQGLSNIALRWMLMNMKKNNVPMQEYLMSDFPTTPANTVFHDERDHWYWRIFDKEALRVVYSRDSFHPTVKGDFNKMFSNVKKEINFDVIDEEFSIMELNETQY